ncbi:hypothetical protein AVEN_101890-1 [Araneus ventricosus]|uniref:CCHC-type domain-containing protein n=1 Tax=Araneus ventricosus TaxID=182803 RepID=A0A4Y2D5F5_ARAVE|nr:hypothetical protein AVEN_240651-1 [Araneus ventricosus]GBM13030.1 hypothetical protein AVEN_101890-1 [Araneus ventricosus]
MYGVYQYGGMVSPLFEVPTFGHSKTSCRGTLACTRCAEVGHESTDCTRTEKCANCKGEQTSFLLSTVETQTDEKLTNVHVPPLTLLKASDPKQQCSKMTFGTGSNDFSNFTTGKKKKANKPSTSVTVAENKTNSVVASKFWKTSPLQVSNPVSMQVSNYPKSKANAEVFTVDNSTLPSAATTEPEPMTTDNVSIHSSDNETESYNAIEYNPHETIDETPPVLQQQSPTSTTVADKTAFKQS